MEAPEDWESAGRTGRQVARRIAAAKTLKDQLVTPAEQVIVPESWLDYSKVVITRSGDEDVEHVMPTLRPDILDFARTPEGGTPEP